jgi:hypothetical protein
MSHRVIIHIQNDSKLTFYWKRSHNTAEFEAIKMLRHKVHSKNNVQKCIRFDLRQRISPSSSLSLSLIFWNTCSNDRPLIFYSNCKHVSHIGLCFALLPPPSGPTITNSPAYKTPRQAFCYVPQRFTVASTARTQAHTHARLWQLRIANPTRNDTAAHSHKFVANDEWLQPNLTAFAQYTRSLHAIRNARCFQCMYSSRTDCCAYQKRLTQHIPYLTRPRTAPDTTTSTPLSSPGLLFILNVFIHTNCLPLLVRFRTAVFSAKTSYISRGMYCLHLQGTHTHKITRIVTLRRAQLITNDVPCIWCQSKFKVDNIYREQPVYEKW